MFSDRALSMEKVDFHFIIQSTSYQRVSYSRRLKIQLKTVAIRVDEMMCSPDFVVLLVWYDVNGEAVRVLENHQTKNLTCFIQQLTEKTRHSGEKANAIHTLHDRCQDNLGLTSSYSSLRCQALYIIPSPITHVTPLPCLTKSLSRWVIMRIVDLISAWNFLLLNSHW